MGKIKTRDYLKVWCGIHVLVHKNLSKARNINQAIVIVIKGLYSSSNYIIKFKKLSSFIYSFSILISICAKEQSQKNTTSSQHLKRVLHITKQEIINVVNYVDYKLHCIAKLMMHIYVENVTKRFMKQIF